MGKWISKKVDEFKVGDRIRLYGFEGVVTEVVPETRYDFDWNTGEKSNFKDCTYLTVHFDHPEQVGYQYQDGSYGGWNKYVGYGCYVED